MSTCPALAARLVRAAGGPDVAGRGGLACPGPGAAAGLVAPPGDAATSSRRLPPLPAGRAAVHRRPAAGGRRAVPAEARAAVLAAADQLLRGEWEVLGVARTDLAAARLVPRPGHRPPVTRGPLRLPDQPPLRGADRQRQAGLGDLPAAAPDAAGHGLVPQPRRAVRRSGSPTSCAPGGGRTPSCPACTGRAASRSASG